MRFVEPHVSLLIGDGCAMHAAMLEVLRIDDPVGAFPVHGLNGIFGTLAIGLFHTELGLFYGGGMGQLGTQLLGVLAAIVFVFPVSLLMFYAMKFTIKLRVPAEVERAGLDGVHHGMSSYPEFGSSYSLPARLKPMAIRSAAPAPQPRRSSTAPGD